MENTHAIDPKEKLRALLKDKAQRNLARYFETLSSQEVVYAMSHLTRQEQKQLMAMLSPEDAADVIEEIPESQAADLLLEMETSDAAAILQEMESDDQADVMMEIEIADAEEILAELSPEDADDVRKRTAYEWDTAGGLMITEYLAFPADHSVEHVIHYFRTHRDEFADLDIKYVYVVSRSGILEGILQMQSLLMASPDIELSEITLRDILTVREQMTLDELGDFFDTHDFYGVPVVNEGGHMLGVVLRKNVLEAYAEQVSIEHMESQGIVGGEELRTMPLFLRSRRRLSWLSVNILLNILAASVIAFHQETLSSVIALAVFLPIISDMSGCSGNQAVAVSMRELSLGIVRASEVMRVWMQEIAVGMINGLVLGLLIGFAAWLWKGSVYLGLVVGGALAINTVVAVSLGGTIPLILKRAGVDPALASGPILTTVTDMMGFFLALTFASIMLSTTGVIH
ncbi:MAG TPA: magnesium transporter [Saprospiraceae bacterium]|nr:magnesium transporter [Saprospiraceae bacterium]